MNRIKWIIFDLGGIVVPEIGDSISRKIAQMLNISFEELKVIKDRYQQQINKGLMTFREMYSVITKEFSINIPPDFVLQEHIKEYLALAGKHNADVVEFIETLKKGYKVACLTNVEPEIFDICKETNLYVYFDRAFISCEMKMQKPDLGIYLKVIEELKCRPDEIIFADDRIENVTAANKAGMHGFLFSNLEQLNSDISLFHC